MSRLLPVLILLPLTAAATAQTIHVVDRLNRPGTSFLDLPAAEAAAVDGDLIRLRADAGSYSAIQTSKAVTIAADLGQAVIISTNGVPFRVAGIQAGLQFTMSDVLLSSRNLSGPVLEVQSCAGRVVLQNVEVALGFPSVRITGCAAVLLQEGRLLGGYPSLAATASNLAISSLQTSGGSAYVNPLQPSGMAIDLQQCTAVLDGVQASGGLGAVGLPPAPALRLVNTTVRAGSGGGAGSLRAGPTGLGGLSAPAVVGSNSSLELQGGLPVVPTGSAPPVQGVASSTASFPSLSGHEWQTQPRAFFGFTGVPGALDIAVTGLPAGPVSLPGISGQLWIDPQAFIPSFGVPVVLDLQLPPGFNTMTQVVSLAPSGAIALSGPFAIGAN